MILPKSSLAVALVATGLISASTASAARVAPDVTKLAIAPTTFKALAAGNSIVQSGGAAVTFNVADGGYVGFTVKSERAGKRSGSKCVAGKAKTKASTCILTSAVPGDFRLIAISGDNNAFRFSGRVGGKQLSPGSYRLVAKAEGTAARSSFVRFKIKK